MSSKIINPEQSSSFFSDAFLTDKNMKEYVHDVFNKLTSQFKPLFSVHDIEVYVQPVPQFSFNLIIIKLENKFVIGFNKNTYYLTHSLAKEAKNMEKDELIDKIHTYFDIPFASLFFNKKHVYKTSVDIKKAYNDIYKRYKNNDFSGTKEMFELDALKNEKLFITDPTELYLSINAFKQFGIEPSQKVLEFIAIATIANTKNYSEEQVQQHIEYLNKTKELCLEYDFSSTNKEFDYHNNSVYFHKKQNALVFKDSNLGFVAFNKKEDPNSWYITRFSSAYDIVKSEKYYFDGNTDPHEFEKHLVLNIHDGKFVQVGGDMFSLHYNLFFAAGRIEEDVEENIIKKSPKMKS